MVSWCWLQLSRRLCAVGCLRRDAVAPQRSAAAQARWRKRRRMHSACQRACIHGAAQAWKCRTSLPTRRAGFCVRHPGARLCGQSASWSKMRRMRPERSPHVVAAWVGWLDAPCRYRFHGLDLGTCRTDPLRKKGHGLLVHALLQRCRRACHLLGPVRDRCRPWCPRRLGLPPGPKGHAGQQACPRPLRRAFAQAGATCGGGAGVGSHAGGAQGYRTA